MRLTARANFVYRLCVDAIARTSLWVAATRALESERPDGLFEDPFARSLAGDEGFEMLRAKAAAGGPVFPVIELRTHCFDAWATRAAERGIRQVVLLAAGMDSRAYRLAWPAGTRLFELDRPEVLAHKAERLAAPPRCERRAIGVDLGDDWPVALLAAGFEARERTLWLVEGLLVYLEEPQVRALLARVDALSHPGSALLVDLAGRSLLEAPWMAPTLEAMRQFGAPWHFGSDEPESLLGPLGWDAEVVSVAGLGARLGRWPVPVAPGGEAGGPRGYLVEATKR